MKFLRCAFCVLFVAIAQVRAQEDVDEKVDDFKPTIDDDMILYTQKWAVKLGFRDISGAKSSFSGTGKISSVQDIGPDEPLTNVRQRNYQDGSVLRDTRALVDPAGRTTPITPDGKTNSWTFASDTQAEINGIIQMHTYSAEVSEASHEKGSGSNLGVDLSVERDMGKLWGGKMQWGVIAGVSINGVSASTTGALTANITTITDYYSLFGQTAPTAPYSSPQSTGGADTTVLIGNVPIARGTSQATSMTAVTNSSRLKGAYMTFRAGPTLFVPISEHFSGTFSAGVALAYTGTTYEVTQTFVPETGDAIVQTIRDGASSLLPGFFVDANLQYAMNETAGLYLGGVYQNTGTFDQEITDLAGQSKYTTHVDLSKLQGIRAGVSFKF